MSFLLVLVACWFVTAYAYGLAWICAFGTKFHLAKKYQTYIKMEAKFSKIYDKNIWGGSGSGSHLSADNKIYLRSIEELVLHNKINTILDVGCGDWEIMKHLNFDGKYLGVDIVKSVIDKNKDKYETDNKKFKHQNVLDGIEEEYDLIIIKDVIQHLDDETILKVMENLLNKGRMVYCVNGYKFGRSPEKNDWQTRSISNRYSYHPVSSEKEPLLRYQEFITTKYKRRCKEYVLFRKIKSTEQVNGTSVFGEHN